MSVEKTIWPSAGICFEAAHTSSTPVDGRSIFTGLASVMGICDLGESQQEANRRKTAGTSNFQPRPTPTCKTVKAISVCCIPCGPGKTHAGESVRSKGCLVQSVGLESFWVRKGIDLVGDALTACRGCLVGHVKSARQKQRTTTLFPRSRPPWTKLMPSWLASAMWTRTLTSWCKTTRTRCASRRRLTGGNDAAGKTKCPSSVVPGAGGRNSGKPVCPQACDPVSSVAIRDAGSIPAASTTFNLVVAPPLPDPARVASKPIPRLDDNPPVAGPLPTTQRAFAL